MPRIRLVLALFAVGALLAAPFAHGATSNVVVSQVFAGGGNAGATYTNDFVELFNRGASAVDLTGWTVQYASASSTSWQATALAGLDRPGPLLPRPARVHGRGRLAAAGGRRDRNDEPRERRRQGRARARRGGAHLRRAAGSCSSAPFVEDLVGYGSATDYEGAGPAPALGSTTAAVARRRRLHATQTRTRGLHRRRAGAAQRSSRRRRPVRPGRRRARRRAQPSTSTSSRCSRSRSSGRA